MEKIHYLRKLLWINDEIINLLKEKLELLENIKKEQSKPVTGNNPVKA